MRDLYKAKEKYNSIEIPEELNLVVDKAISQAQRKKKTVSFYAKRVASLAACVAVLVAVAFNVLPWRNSGVVLQDQGTPAAASMRRVMSYSPAVANRVATELETLGEVTELFSDDEFVSVSVQLYTTDEAVYYNMYQKDASDISLSELVSGIDENDAVGFYIKSSDTVVVFEDDVEKEYKILEK